MASPELLAKIAAKLAELSAATKPAQEAYRGINPELLKTFAMQVKSPEGKALGELMSPELVQRLNDATPVLRRKSISDLSQPQLGTVFTANKTGASAGVNRSREARQDYEPAMFGGNPVYGSLTEDLKAPMDSKLSLRYPKTGNSTVLASDAVVSGYGPYGFIPKGKSKFTYTLGDSLDTGRGVSIGDARAPADLMGGHHDDSALGALAQYFYDQRVKKILELGLNDTKYGVYAPDNPAMRGLKWDDPARLAWEKEQDELMRAFNADYGGDGPVSRALNTAGVHGLPGQYSTAPAQARLLPRNFGEQGLPMSPMEEQYSLDVPKYLNGKHPYGYVEIQGHGVTPDDIAQVVDYSLEPSLAVEKKLKKLGIDYNPIVPPDSLLSQVQALIKANPSRAALSAKMKELGHDGIARELDYWKKPDSDLPKISTNYAAGGPVANKRPEMEHKVGAVNQSARDNPLTGSALKALVRGWMAGTAGLPGDIEGLARKGINFSFGPGGVNVNPDSALPTTDFYKEWLPGKQVGDENVTEVGSLFGGVGATKPVSLAKGALTRVAQAAPGPLAGTRAAMKGVIKAPGGNWLSGSVEDALKGLKRPMQMDTIQAQRAAGIPVDEAGIAQNTGLNSFIDKQLTRYVKNDMATERDPIRALAEQGTLHFEPTGTGNPGLGTRVNREHVGFDPQGLGQSTLARQWESASDALVRPSKAGDVLADKSIGGSGVAEKKIADNLWLSKAPADSQVNEIYNGSRTQDLGFDHLIDELRNATNPQSGLPAHLLLDPASLDRVSVPDAVKRVAAINEWRAAQKAEANSAIANNAATVPFKEYAENNPKGLRWVELKQPAKPTQLPAGYTVAPQDTGAGFYVLGPDKNPIAIGRTPEDAIASWAGKPDTSMLQDALKYEGDTMGHCVGGYCDDVASGKSRIFSLRDSKGQPHVTIEAKPGIKAPEGAVVAEDLPPDVYADFKDRNILDPKHVYVFNQAAFDRTGSGWRPHLAPTEDTVIQIKGKGNKKPNDEYLPFVQDFVRSGKWSDVGDLQNSGLRKATDAFNTVEREKIKAAGIELPNFLPQSEIDEIGRKVWPTSQLPPPGYAAGGPVQHFDAGGEVAGPGYTARGDDFTPYDPLMEAHKERVIKEQAAHTARNTMSREDFLKKYGQTFVADDKGGNAASEVAGQDVGAYYDLYLADGATGDGSGFGWKYRDAHPYFDAWDNVDPHPTSQDLGGVGEFWRQIGRPAATAAAMYAGVGAIGGMLGGAGAAGTGAAAAGTGGAAGIGSGTALGGATGAAAAPTASGVAGMMGMAPGYGATALNTGVLNTGMSLVRGKNIGDSLKSGATSALLSPISSYVGDAVGGGYTGQVAGDTVLGGVQGAINGQGFGKGLQDGFVNGLVSSAGKYVGGVAKGATGNNFAGTAANSLTQSTLRGRDPKATLDSLATQYAAGELTDLSGMDPKMAQVVITLARNKKVSPVGALTIAQNAVGSPKLRKAAVGG